MKEFLVYLFACCRWCQDDPREDVVQRMQDPIFNSSSSFRSDSSVDFLDLESMVPISMVPMYQDKAVQTDNCQVEYPEVQERLLKVLHGRSFPVPFDIKMQLVASLNSSAEDQDARKEFWEKFSIEHNVPPASSIAIQRLLIYNCAKPTFSVKHCGSSRKKPV